MTERPDDRVSERKPRTLVDFEQLDEILAQRLDVEAIAGFVERLDFEHQLSDKLTKTFNELRQRDARLDNAVAATQQELRQLMLDVELIKRALVSLGHIGVLERGRIEKELVRDVLPPSVPRPGLGLRVAPSQTRPAAKIDCATRLHLCKASCCRIFQVHLTAAEVNDGLYTWDSQHPFALERRKVGCVHLTAGSCQCAIYDSRPTTCQTYSCENDRRIWKDFAGMVLNPELEERLRTLDVNTAPATGPAPQPTVRGEQPAVTARQQEEQVDRELRGSCVKTSELATTHLDASMPQSSQKGEHSVSPPDFDDLRRQIVSPPLDRFAPPPNEEGSNRTIPPDERD